MKNKFTLENTKDATHIAFSALDNEFRMRVEKRVLWQGGDVGNAVDPLNNYDLDLTDQTGRGYPTLEWFLKCGHKLEAGDAFIGLDGVEAIVRDPDISNAPERSDNKRYVKYLHDDRHDLTAMARDEYYSKHEKQWPNNDRIDVIGQNGNNGEHYPHESESPLSPNFEIKPVYTQEMHDNGELPPVGSECLALFIDNDDDHNWLNVKILMHNENKAAACYLIDDELFDGRNLLWSADFKPIDTRTYEEKLRDAIRHELVSCHLTENVIDNLMDKFTITLNEEG